MLALSISSTFLTGISARLGLLFSHTCSSKYSVQPWAQRSVIKVFPFLEQTDRKLAVLYRQHALLLTALSPELANSICTLATISNLLSLMYIATPEQPASYLFITRTSHLYHTRPQNAPHATHKFRVLLLNARTQQSFDQTDDGVDAETSLSLSLSAFLSLFSAFTLFSLAHIWSINSL